LRLFELRLLDELGYGLQLSSTANGDAIISERRYLYTPDAGFTPADSGVSGATLHALHNGAWNTRMERREARDLMRTVLDHHLGHRPIRSRELFH
jgi:DNA repair protein RecO (recombination protein O)